MNTTIKIILIAFVSVFLSSCINNNKGNKTERFLQATSQVYSGNIKPQINSAFKIVQVLLPSETETHYIYILDASCSVCIANALDCYNAYDTLFSDDESCSFDFISTTKDVDIFDYYFKKSFSDKESNCHFYADFDLPIGIYTVMQGQLIAYSPWE